MFIVFLSISLAFAFLLIGLCLTGLSAKKWTLGMKLTFSGQCCCMLAVILIIIPLWKPAIAFTGYIADPLINVGALLTFGGISHRFSQFLPDITFRWRRRMLTRAVPLTLVKIIGAVLVIVFAIQIYAIIQSPNVPIGNNLLWAQTIFFNVIINVSSALLDISYCVIMYRKVVGRVILHKTGTNPILHLSILVTIKVSLILLGILSVFLEFEGKLITVTSVIACYVSTDGLFMFSVRHLMTLAASNGTEASTFG